MLPNRFARKRHKQVLDQGARLEDFVLAVTPLLGLCWSFSSSGNKLWMNWYGEGLLPTTHFGGAAKMQAVVMRHESLHRPEVLASLQPCVIWEAHVTIVHSCVWPLSTVQFRVRTGFGNFGKVLEFQKLNSRPWKSMEFGVYVWQSFGFLEIHCQVARTVQYPYDLVGWLWEF